MSHEQAKADQQHDNDAKIKEIHDWADSIERQLKKVHHGLDEDVRKKIKCQVLVTIYNDGTDSHDRPAAIHAVGVSKDAGPEGVLTILSTAITTHLASKAIENRMVGGFLNSLGTIFAGAPSDDGEENSAKH